MQISETYFKIESMIKYTSTKSKKLCIVKHRKIEYKRKLSDAITLRREYLSKKTLPQ